MHESIIKFIQAFCNQVKIVDLKTAFTSGLCFWFAHILHTRFPESKIVYDPVANHFAVLVRGRLYDITGEVTGEYKVIDWDSYDDTIHKKRITEQCINFTKG